MNIMKDSFFLTLSKGIRSIVMMIVVMVMTRITSMEVYGAYRQLITLSTIILAIAPLGIPISVSYYYKNIDINQRSKLISNTAAICFICGLTGSLFFIIFKNQISKSLNINEIDNYLPGFSLYIFILVTSSFIENLYVSAEFAKKFSIYNSIYYIFFLIILIGVIYKGNKLSIIILVMSVMESLRFIFLLIWIMNKLEITFSVDTNFIKEQFIYCIPLGLVGIMQVLNTHLDKLIISGYFTSTEFAIYSTGTMEIPIVNLVTISLATAALPHMSKEYNTNHNIKEALQIWGKITITGAAIIFPIFFILGFYNKEYIGFLFSEKYFSCIPVFLMHLLRLPLSCTIFGNMLIIMGKQKVTIFNMLISIVINIVCNIFLIPIMGMTGATLSGVIMHITIIFLQLYQISKYTELKIRNLMPYNCLFKIFCVSFIVVLPIYLLSNLFNLQNIPKFFIFGSMAFFISMYSLTKLKLVNYNLSKKITLLEIKKTGSFQDIKDRIN